MKKRLVRILLILSVLLLVFGAVSVSASDQLVSFNKGAQTYSGNWASPIKSHLTPTVSGYERCEYVSGRGLRIEQYDQDFNYISGFYVDMELPLYGGVYYHSNFNFLITGQYNLGESDDVEVFRITKYDKNWNRLGACSIKGADTSTPFRAGTVRCTDAQGKLYVRTCHEMYTGSDGLKHQSSATFAVDMYNMRLVCTDATLRQSSQHTNSRGYVSHSFNQFIQVDGSTLLIVDHGDAFPRAVSLMKYKNSTSKENFYSGKTTGVNVLDIPGTIGANYTGVQVGGFEYSSTNYLVAGNAVTDTNQKNIYVTSTSKNNFSAAGSELIWITDHTSGVNVSNVHLVKVSGTSFFLAWTEDDILTYTFLDQYGHPSTQIYTAAGMLSDCKPVVSDNQIIWYATDNSRPYFYVIDLSDKDTVNFIHDCSYTWDIALQPTESDTGLVTVRCTRCDESFQLTMPVLNEVDYRVVREREPGCYETGVDIYYWDTDYGTIEVFHSTPMLEHEYGEWVIIREATCQYDGRRASYCIHCGSGVYENYSVDHEYTAWEYVGADCTTVGYRYRRCLNCWDWQQEDYGGMGHDYAGLYCSACGECRFTDIQEGAYYVEPVAWAVMENVTSGTGNGTTFSPSLPCTRAQVVTMIWRAAGEPRPRGENPFSDVPEGQWYTDAVLWAVERGITTGVGDGTRFAPNDSCTRSQVVTFLHRMAGEEQVSFENPFNDVEKTDWFYDAVLWAVANQITQGTGSGSFSPDITVDRAQFVTFLYRAKEFI